MSLDFGELDLLYLTPELYKFLQRSDLSYSERAAKWNDAVIALREHHKTVRPFMRNNMSSFMDVTLHDGVVNRVQRHLGKTLSLEIDGRHCPWGPRGLFILSFRGTRSLGGLDECVNARWLYEEVHLDAEANFSYQVLLFKQSNLMELHIAADDVDFIITEPGVNNVMGVNIRVQTTDGLYVWSGVNDSDTHLRWCCISDGRKVPQGLPQEVRERLRPFATGMGAVFPDEVKGLLPGDQS